MPSTCLFTRLLEHNSWANAALIRACAAVAEAQLDERPQPAEWSLRQILVHIVECQHNYALLLTLPVAEREAARLSLEDAGFAELEAASNASGEKLLELVRDPEGAWAAEAIHSADGYVFEPWVVLVQAVNHATDHRKQISIRLKSLGVTAPRLDGWGFGEAADALHPKLT